MAKRTEARPAAARPRASVSVPAFGGWEAAGGAAAAADYSLDFTKIRAARMQRRKALSWSSFVGNSPAVVVATEAPGCGGGGGDDEVEEKRQWSSVAASDDDDDDRERRRYRHRHSHRHRRLRSDDDDRQPIQPAPKGRSKFRGYLFGCVGGGLW